MIAQAETKGLSQRAACRYTGISRAVCRYVLRRPVQDAQFLEKMRVVVQSKVINRGFSRQNHLGFYHYQDAYCRPSQSTLWLPSRGD